jgi:hypothetical protein
MRALASTKRSRVFSSSDFGFVSDFEFRASGFGGSRVTNLNQDLTAFETRRLPVHSSFATGHPPLGWHP